MIKDFFHKFLVNYCWLLIDLFANLSQILIQHKPIVVF